VVTSVPSGSTPPADDEALGDQNVAIHLLSYNPNEPASFADISSDLGSCTNASVNVTKTASCRAAAQIFRHVCDTLPPTASIPLPFFAQDTLALHPTVTLVSGSGAVKSGAHPWQQPTATDLFAAYSINNDNKKTPTSENISTPAVPLHPKPPCACMCPLEQTASGTAKTEWKTEVVDDSAASMPPKKKTTTHSDNTTAPHRQPSTTTTRRLPTRTTLAHQPHRSPQKLHANACALWSKAPVEPPRLSGRRRK
jgi:hypothetical protein